MSKPPLPVAKFHDFPRIPVDMSDGTDAHHIASWAAMDWVLGPDGPYKQPEMTMAQTVRQILREGLTHLLELGFIDIDTERMHAAPGWPMGRTDGNPATTEETVR